MIEYTHIYQQLIKQLINDIKQIKTLSDYKNYKEKIIQFKKIHVSLTNKYTAYLDDVIKDTESKISKLQV